MLLLARIFFARQGRKNRAYLGYVRFCLTRYSGKKTAKITFLFTYSSEVRFGINYDAKRNKKSCYAVLSIYTPLSSISIFHLI